MRLNQEELVIKPMQEGSRKSYKQLFEKLKNRGKISLSFVISDAHRDLEAEFGIYFPDAGWQ